MSRKRDRDRYYDMGVQHGSSGAPPSPFAFAEGNFDDLRWAYDAGYAEGQKRFDLLVTAVANRLAKKGQQQ